MSVTSNYPRFKSTGDSVIQLIRRLHFYAGMFIGPLIFTAALSGTLYVLTPQIENKVYADLLFTDLQGEHQPLALQIKSAQTFMHRGTISAVRPSPGQGLSTRVMFITPEHGPSESVAVFIDPVDLSVLGAETVYGTSGILPLRTMIDYFHTNLLLGEVGRHYSEIAASWLWLVSAGGVILWGRNAWRRRKMNSSGPFNLRRLHTSAGLCFILVFFFMSATGLTWSRWAGENIGWLRSAMSWTTPSLNTSLSENMTPVIEDEHAHHRQPAVMPSAGEKPEVYPALFYWVDAAARKAGIDAPLREIRPPKSADQAWVVAEIDRRWPTQVDSAAVDARTFNVTHKVSFSDYGLMARLTRWGIDAHMGILFGLPNQLLMAMAGLSLCFMTISGYVLWWRRRPLNGKISPSETLRHAFVQLSLTGRIMVALTAVSFGVAMPMLGVTIIIFIAIDQYRWLLAVRNQHQR